LEDILRIKIIKWREHRYVNMSSPCIFANNGMFYKFLVGWFSEIFSNPIPHGEL